VIAKRAQVDSIALPRDDCLAHAARFWQRQTNVWRR
jgi:hypothetical protein